MNTWDEDEHSKVIKTNHINVSGQHKMKGESNKNLVETFWQFTKDLLTYGGIGREKIKGCVAPNSTYRRGPLIKTRQPKLYLLSHSLPKTWDWRDIDGVNYLSWTVNQHIPKWCGSCWAQATTSALADRFIIADRYKYANLALSPQVIINCRGGGSCEGGNPAQVYEFANEVGVMLLLHNYNYFYLLKVIPNKLFC